MTWIGKILAALVMVASLVWMFLTAQSFATRTNWKAESDKYKVAYESAIKAREKDYRAGKEEQDALAKQLAAANKTADDLRAQTLTLETDKAAQIERYNQFEKVNTDLQTEFNKLKSNYDSSLEQVKQLRAQNNTLEDERVKLVLEREKALADRQQAINERNTALTRSDQLTRENETLSVKLTAFKRAGGGKIDAVADSLTQRPATVPENIRGTVVQVSGNLVTLSLGLDAGLTPGAVLDVSRLKPEPKYLGKVTIGTIIAPKSAVATFHSATGSTVDRLRADERPKVGDTVSLIGR